MFCVRRCQRPRQPRQLEEEHRGQLEELRRSLHQQLQTAQHAAEERVSSERVRGEAAMAQAVKQAQQDVAEREAAHQRAMEAMQQQWQSRVDEACREAEHKALVAIEDARRSMHGAAEQEREKERAAVRAASEEAAARHAASIAALTKRYGWLLVCWWSSLWRELVVDLREHARRVDACQMMITHRDCRLRLPFAFAFAFAFAFFRFFCAHIFVPSLPLPCCTGSKRRRPLLQQRTPKTRPRRLPLLARKRKPVAWRQRQTLQRHRFEKPWRPQLRRTRRHRSKPCDRLCRRRFNSNSCVTPVPLPAQIASAVRSGSSG